MNYLEALERAILYIEGNLGEDIRVEDVANAAGYSYYHLTRQFSALLGESIGSYIKKRRLADGAKKLIYTDRKIIDIALENGFCSSEAFSRAFKAVYRKSPLSYRKNRIDLMVAAKDQLDRDLLAHRISNMTVQPKVVEIKAIKVAGLRGQTTLRDNRIPELWNSFQTIVDQITNRVSGGRFFGICEACNEGNSLGSMNQDVLFSEVAAVEVDSFADLPSRLIYKTIPEGKYAVFTHKGSLRKLSQTFSYIWGTWVSSTVEQLDEREDFELYDQRYLGYDHPQSEIDLYIPIR